jgi:energy-coupling factor transporter ATP-binding protein EcfA2
MTTQLVENVVFGATELVRPSLSFESITFSDGQTLNFEDDEIVVFVGPNNAGKSASLRELKNYLSSPTPQTVIARAVIKAVGNSNNLRDYLEKHSQKTGITANLTYSGTGYNIHHSHVSHFDQIHNRGTVAPFFVAHVATENRIVGSNPAGAIALHQAPATEPIHQLLIDPTLASDICKLFKTAFGEDLIVLRAGGSTYPLYVGKKPENKIGEDE